MIEALRGTIVDKTPEFLTLDVSGVIFGVKITFNTYASLPGEGQSCFIHVDTVFGEKEIELYGFSEEKEKELFRKLRRLRGIGPRIARNLLSGLSVAELAEAVERGDETLLSKIPGVGPKTARRLVIELRDILTRMEMPRVKKEAYQAVDALINLGFSRREAETAVASVAKECESLEDIIRTALQRLVRGKKK